VKETHGREPVRNVRCLKQTVMDLNFDGVQWWGMDTNDIAKEKSKGPGD
jgi:hypothetical protein